VIEEMKPTVYIESSVISYFCLPEELGGAADDE
jgi:hypothetical protein